MQNDAEQAMHLKYVINLCLLFPVSLHTMQQLFLSGKWRGKVQSILLLSELWIPHASTWIGVMIFHA